MKFASRNAGMVVVVEVVVVEVVVVSDGTVVVVLPVAGSGVQLTAKKATAMAAISTLLLFISLQGSAAYAESRYYVTFCDFFQFLGWSAWGQNSIIIAMENKITAFFKHQDLDVRKSYYRFMDQKVTPDVLAFISDCILNYTSANSDPFTKDDIWESDYFKKNVVYIYGKPEADNAKAAHEYDKFTAQPMKTLAYAGVLTEKKIGIRNVYKVNEREILEFIALNDRNAIKFLYSYISKVLADSGFYTEIVDYVSSYRSKQFSSANFDKLKSAFDEFMLENSRINGTIEIHRIFPKVFNIIAFTENVPGSRKGRVTAEPYLYSDLMYNAINFRDIGKLKNVTRQESDRIAHSVQDYGDYEMSKAISFVKRRHAPNSEVKDDLASGEATVIHHIFPKSAFPELRSTLENLILLTPSQHYTKAHPSNRTHTIDPNYQLTCLDAKSYSVEASVEQGDGFYSRERLIKVINTGLNIDLNNEANFKSIRSTLAHLRP